MQAALRDAPYPVGLGADDIDEWGDGVEDTRSGHSRALPMRRAAALVSLSPESLSGSDLTAESRGCKEAGAGE
jgi:hypothetical protein